MKRFFAIMMSIVMLIALCVPAFAAEEKGSITISNAVPGETYAIYKMADLESYDTSKNAYSYKPADGWTDFFTAHSGIFELDNGYIWLKTDATVDAAKLAKEALAYAAEKNIQPVQTITAEKDKQVKFDNLALGYYLIDSSLGALCGLTTTKPDAEIEEKNGTPGVDKKVQEDSDSSWGKQNDADLFQTINFRTTITAQAGAQNYVLHDKMTGMTLDAGSIKVYRGSVADDNLVGVANYTVNTNPDDGCTFEIVFKQEFCDTLAANDQIIVTYSAALKEDAIVGGNGNPNETWLEYGDENNVNTTPKVTTTTFTYEFDVVKTEVNNKLLDGAEFKLYDAETGGSEIKLVKQDNGTYRAAKAGETPVAAIEVKDGKVTITGLDGHTTYWLEETKAPAGYNRLAARQKVEIVNANLTATFEVSGAYKEGGVQVVNKTGAELPSTGGFGTVLFTLIGGALVVGCGILLVTKKRMNKIAE